MAEPPFAFQTCEDQHNPRVAPLPFVPPAGRPWTAPFLLDDPFGLRKAIVPVFRSDPEGNIAGLGTAFHVDGWGTFLTADHVVDLLRGPGPFDPNILIEREASTLGDAAVLMLGAGLVFGRVGVPPTLWAPISGVQFLTTEFDNPLGVLRGEGTHRVEIDLCSVQAQFHPNAATPATVKVNLANWHPTVGDYVFACGYPQLAPRDITPETQRQLVVDGLYGCYGRVTAAGRGEEQSRRNCLFEVEADWPSGMSGGPVFNHAGEVVGIVSRSLGSDGVHRDVAHAVCLSWVPNVGRLVPWLDVANPGYRFAIGVLRRSPWHLAAVCRSLSEADLIAESLGPEYHAAPGVHEIGADGFVQRTSW